MEVKRLDIPFKYAVDEIPPRCRKPRRKEYEDTITVEIPMLTGDEAPVALRLSGEHFGDKYLVDFRWYRETLWATRQIDGMFVRSGLHKEPTKYDLVRSYAYDGRDAAVTDIDDRASDYLYVDGEVYRSSREPMYFVDYYDGGGFVSVRFDYPGGRDSASYWPLNRRMDAIRQASLRGEEPTIHDTVAILIPEVVKAKAYAERVVHKGKLIVEYDIEWAEETYVNSSLVTATEDYVLKKLHTELDRVTSERLYSHAPWRIGNIAMRVENDKRTIPCLICGRDTAPAGEIPPAGLDQGMRCSMCNTWICPYCEDTATGWCINCANQKDGGS